MSNDPASILLDATTPRILEYIAVVRPETLLGLLKNKRRQLDCVDMIDASVQRRSRCRASGAHSQTGNRLGIAVEQQRQVSLALLVELGQRSAERVGVVEQNPPIIPGLD